MNNPELITDLYKYFSRFIQKDVLKKLYIQPRKSKKTGYDEIQAEVLSYPDNKVIDQLSTYVFSINENYLSEKIKNAKGFLLFIEYGGFSVEYNQSQGIKEKIAVTVAHDFSDANNDNLNETILMQGSFLILEKIIGIILKEAEELECPISAITQPMEISVVDPVSFYGRGGWSATFSTANTFLS